VGPRQQNPFRTRTLPDQLIKVNNVLRSVLSVSEEHNLIGGLGSAVLESLRAIPHPPVELVAIEDCFGLSAACYDKILTHFGLTDQVIADAAMRILQGSSSTKH
jgi:transketolase